MRKRPHRSDNNLGKFPTIPLVKADVRIITECRSEAFWTRGLPLMIGMSTATHFLVKTNKLSPHPRYGSFFKVVWAAFFGNIIGKISYQVQD